jgi:tellurium resistance protein TerD
MEQKILQKGANLSLSKTVPSLVGVMVNIGWKLPPNYSLPFDVDSCVFLLTQQGQVRTDADLIYYNNRTSVCGTVEQLDSDQSTGEDLEIIRADLNKLPAEIVRLVFAVTIHEAASRQQHFNLLSEVVIKVRDLEINTPPIFSSFALGPDERIKLRKFLVEQFNVEKLKKLALDISVDYESLPHNTTETFSRELMAYFERRNDITRLLKGILKQADNRFIAELLAQSSSSEVIDKSEIVRYILKQDAGHETAMILGEIYRYNNEWKFKAIGQGFEGGFKALVANFGITT